MSYEVTTANSRLEIETQYYQGGAVFIVDANHFICLFGGNNTGIAQVLTVNTSTWAVTTANDWLVFDAGHTSHHACAQIDTNHFLGIWTQSDGIDDHVQVFTVNTTTWAVTTAGDALEFVSSGDDNSCAQIDTNHFINFYSGTDYDGFVQVLTVNTSTWAVTTASSVLEFDTQNCNDNSCYKIDANHFINFYSGVDNDGFAQVFTVNTSTWAVTTASAKLEFDTSSNGNNSCTQIDDNHFINFWNGTGAVQVLTVNTTTWAVTAANSKLVFENGYCRYHGCVQLDINHFVDFFQRDGDTSVAQVFEVNTTTWAVTTCSDVLDFDTQTGVMTRAKMAPVIIDSGAYILNLCHGTDSDGFAQVFNVKAQYAESFSEAFSISESFKKSPELLKSVNVELSELKKLAFEKIDSDDVSFLEGIAKSPIIPLSDSLSFNETKVLEIEKILAENLNLNVVALKITFEKVFDETLTLAESLIKLMTFEKTFTETETLVETFSKESGKTLSESISFLEDLRKGLNLFPSEVLSLNEAKEWEVGKKITDLLALTEMFTESIGLSETDTISLSESVSRILEARRNFSEFLALIENIAPITTFKRTLISVLTLTETISKFAEQTLEDSITLTESILPILGIALTESIAFLPVAPKFTIKHSLSDKLMLVEINSSKTDFQRVFSDTLTFVENLIKNLNLKKTESVLLADIFKKLSSLSLTETLNLTEVFEKITGLKKTDYLTMSETFSKRIALQKADNITLTEIIALDIILKSSFYEALLLTDSFIAERQLILSDLFSLVEVITKLSDTQILKGETLILTESLERDSEKSLTDDFILSDKMVKSINIELVDNLNLLETLIQTSTFNLPLQEALALIESLSTVEKESIPQKVVLLTKGQKTHLFFRQ